MGKITKTIIIPWKLIKTHIISQQGIGITWLPS